MCNQNDNFWEWSVFWHSNQLHTCMPFEEDHDVLDSVWRAFFGSLPCGATILDLGTGNGSLAAQALVVSKRKSAAFSIHGVDLADIEPFRYVASADKLLDEIIFHPRTAMENLPFEAQTFDAIGSQYAIEYSNIKQSLQEALRVLKPGGRLRFLLHANDGILKQRCAEQYKQAQTILASDLFTATTELLSALVEAETKHSQQAISCAEERILRLKNVFEQLEREFSEVEDRSLIDSLFAALRSLPDLRKSQSLQALIKMNKDIQLLLMAQSKRLHAMQQAALDDIKMNEMAEQLRLLKLERVSLQKASTVTGARCIGYWLSAEKPVENSIRADEGSL